MAIALATRWHSIRGADLLLRLRIQPRSAREGIDRVRDGAANESLIRLLARLDSFTK
jgi:uncharacterized protein YggU (UPF0235/DUF167 family)